MNRKRSLSQLIEIFTAFASITLLAVIAEREEPGGDQHLISLGIVLVLLMIYAASECSSDCFTRPKSPEELDTQDKRGNDQ